MTTEIPITPGALSAQIIDGKLLVLVPRTALAPSKGGKTLMVAKTGGFKPVGAKVQGQEIRVNVNAYIYPPEPDAADDEARPSGVSKFRLPPRGHETIVELTQESLVICSDVNEKPVLVPEEGKKMIRVAGGGAAITTAITLKGKPLVVSFYAGIYPPK